MQIPYTIDLLVIACIVIGTFLALAQRYIENKVFKTISWLIGLILGVAISAVSWLHLYFLALIYLIMILLAFLAVYYPILDWLPSFIRQRKTQSSGMLSDEEVEIWSKLKEKWGYGFSLLQVRIIIAMRKGRKTPDEIAKFVNKPVKEVKKNLDKLVERRVLEP